jgi:hypothetical protein
MAEKKRQTFPLDRQLLPAGKELATYFPAGASAPARVRKVVTVS